MPEKPHILFVCGRNQWRSPTAARLYANDQRMEVRSAGVSPQSRRLLAKQDIEWADLILVMEQEHKVRIRETFRDLVLPAIESLDIPDDYGFMDDELIRLLQEGTEFYLKECFTSDGATGLSTRRGMMKITYCISAFILLSLAQAATAAELPDISTVAPDLTVPAMTADVPAAGRRVKVTLPAYRSTEVYHALYLPSDWQAGRRYPVIVEYAGNGAYSNRYGDVSNGTVEGSRLGYGASGGKGFIWVCAPYISSDHRRNQPLWWGDIEATVGYCTGVVAEVCARYGGDPAAVFLAGFSRGSIGCNYIGLHDDGIASLWRGFICHSHYDGVRTWSYAESDRASAAVRLARLRGRPQFISQEGSTASTQAYLAEACPQGRFTFAPLPYRNHTDAWTLRDIPERAALRVWLAKTAGVE